MGWETVTSEHVPSTIAVDLISCAYGNAHPIEMFVWYESYLKWLEYACNWPIILNYEFLTETAADDFKRGHKKKKLGLEQKHFDQTSVFYAYEKRA